MTAVITELFYHYFLAKYFKYHLQKLVLKSKGTEGRRKTEDTMFPSARSNTDKECRGESS